MKRNSSRLFLYIPTFLFLRLRPENPMLPTPTPLKKTRTERVKKLKKEKRPKINAPSEGEQPGDCGGGARERRKTGMKVTAQ
jgi:hypothetical protein